MPKKIYTCLENCNLWKLAVILLSGGILFLASLSALKLFMPIRDSIAALDPNSLVGVADPNNSSAISVIQSDMLGDMAQIMRPGLFKPATPINDKPLADKTIQRIRDQLKLLCVLNLDTDPKAYINVTNEGMKECKIGDDIGGLFKVLDISKSGVLIDIIGHKEVLSF